MKTPSQSALDAYEKAMDMQPRHLASKKYIRLAHRALVRNGYELLANDLQAYKAAAFN